MQRPDGHHIQRPDGHHTQQLDGHLLQQPDGSNTLLDGQPDGHQHDSQPNTHHILPIHHSQIPGIRHIKQLVVGFGPHFQQWLLGLLQKFQQQMLLFQVSIQLWFIILNKIVIYSI